MKCSIFYHGITWNLLHMEKQHDHDFITQCKELQKHFIKDQLETDGYKLSSMSPLIRIFQCYTPLLSIHHVGCVITAQ